MSLTPERFLLPEFPSPESLDLSKLSTSTLGYAVLHHIQNPQIEIRNKDNVANTTDGHVIDRSETVSVDLAENDKFNQKIALDSVRQRIYALGKQTDDFNYHIRASISEDFQTGASCKKLTLMQARQATENVGYATWLRQDASSDELIGFLSWNAARLIRKQSSIGLQAAFFNIKYNFEQAVKKGIRAGRFSPDAEENVSSDTLWKTQFYLGDYMDMQAEGRAGYVRRNKPNIYIVEPIFNGTFLKGERKTIRHELGHSVLGFYADALRDEAITDHIAVAMESDDWDNITKHKGEYASYPNIRQVANLLWKDRIKQLIYLYTARSAEERARTEHTLNKGLSKSDRLKIANVATSLGAVEAIAVGKKISSSLEVEKACDLLLSNDKPRALQPIISSPKRKDLEEFIQGLISKQLKFS